MLEMSLKIGAENNQNPHKCVSLRGLISHATSFLKGINIQQNKFLILGEELPLLLCFNSELHIKFARFALLF